MNSFLRKIWKSESARARKSAVKRGQKVHLEVLEPRVLLSADDLIPGVSIAIGDGLSEMASRLQEYVVTQDSSFENPVPGVLWFDADSGESGAYVTPEIKDLLKIDVADRDGDGRIDGIDAPVAGLLEAQYMPGTLFLGNDFNDSDGDGTAPLVHQPGSGVHLDMTDPLNVWHLISGDYYYSYQGVLWWAFVPSAELALSAMDMDDSGAVEWQEAFDVLVVGQMQDWMDNSDAQYYPTLAYPGGAWGSPITDPWSDFNHLKWDGSSWVNKSVSEFLAELDTFLESGLQAPAALVSGHAYHSAYPSGQLLATNGESLVEVDIGTVTAHNLGPGFTLTMEDVKFVFNHDVVMDLGYQSDQLNISVGTEKPANSSGIAEPGLEATKIQVEAGVYFDDLIIGLQGYAAKTIPNPTPPPDTLALPDGTPTGPTDVHDFFITVPDGSLEIGVKAHHTGIVTDVNVGFLGTSTSTGEFLIDMGVDTLFHDPSHPDALGFVQTLPVMGTTGLLAGEVPEPENFILPSDVIFTLKIGLTATSPLSQIKITAASTQDNATLDDLIDDINDALADASPYDLSGLITAGKYYSGGEWRLKFSLPDADITPLGFSGNELYADPYETITATSAASMIGTTDVTPVSFLVSVDGALPILVTVTPTLFDDGNGDPSDDVVTLASLISDINAELRDSNLQFQMISPLFSYGVFARDNAGNIELYYRTSLLQPDAKSIEISRALILDAENVITYDELHSTSADNLLSNKAGWNTDDALQISLPLKVKAGLKDQFGMVYEPTATLKVNINPFTGFSMVEGEDEYDRPDFNLTNAAGKTLLQIRTDKADTDIDPADWSPGDTAWANMLDFTVINANSVLGGLSQLQSWLERLPESQLLANYQLPFAQAVMGDVLDFADVLEDALIIDDGDDGLQPKPGADDATDTGKLIAWLMDGDNANLVVTFDTAQELAARLVALPLGSDAINPRFHTGKSELTYDIRLSHPFEDVAVPADFSLDLSPLDGLFTESTLYVGVEGFLNTTLGFKLGSAAKAISAETTLDGTGGLNGDKGVTISDILAVTGVDDVSSYVGRLSADAIFEVTVTTAGGAVMMARVTVPKSLTDSNKTLENLLQDIDLALDAAKELDEFGNATANTLHLKADYGITAEAVGDRVRLITSDADVIGFSIDSTATSTAFTELGLQPEQAVTVSLTGATPASVQLTENKTFTVTLFEGLSSTTYSVTVLKTDTDGNRTVTDLVNDINLAFGRVDIGGGKTLLDRFVASRDGNQIVYGAIDPDVNFFRMEAQAAIQELGINWEWLQPLVATTDIVSADGHLTADQSFMLNVTYSDPSLDGVYGTITVFAADTADNDDIGDLVDDLNEALTDKGVGGRIVAAAEGQRIVLKAASASVINIVVLAGGSAGELGFTNSSYDSTAMSSAGVQLKGDKDIPSPYLGQLTDDISLGLSITTTSGTLNKTLNIDADATNGALPGTDPNAGISELVADLNAVISADIDLAGKILAQVSGQRIVLRAIDPSVLSFEVTAGAGALGIETGQTATADLSVLANKSAPLYYGPGGEATFTVSFTGGTLDGNAYTVKVGTVDPATGRADYLDNSSIYSLVSDMNRALSKAVLFDGDADPSNDVVVDLRPYVAASNDGYRMVLMQAAGAEIGTDYTGFSVEALSPTNPAATDLHLIPHPQLDPPDIDGVVEADSADLLIYTQNGHVYRVSLDDATNIGMVADRIYAQTDHLVTLEYDASGTAINLRDSSTGSSLFRVDTVNRSGAAISLGIFGADTTTVDETPDGLIEGQAIAAIKLADRVFVRNLGSEPFLDATVTVKAIDDPSTPEYDALSAKGAFGFVGVNLIGPFNPSVATPWMKTDDPATPDIDESLQAEPGAPQETLYTGDFASSIVYAGPPERTMTDLFKALTAEDSVTKAVLPGTIDELSAVISRPTFTGTADFGLLATLDGAISGMATPLNLGDGRIIVSLDNLGNAFAAPPFVTLGDPFGDYVLVEDFSFEVAIDGGVTRTVTVLADNTDGDNLDTGIGGGAANTSLADLVADFNYAIAKAKLDDYIVATSGSLKLQGASPFSGIRFTVTPLSGLPYWSTDAGIEALEKIGSFDPGLPTLDVLDSLGQHFETALGNLGDFQDIGFDQVMDAMDGLLGFLDEFDTTYDFFRTEIPFLGLSLDDVMDFVDRLRAAVEDIRQNPAGSLQMLAQKIRENFGLPDFSKELDPAAAMQAYFQQYGITDPASDVLKFAFATLDGDDILRIDLRLPVGFKKAIDVDLDLGDLAGVDLGPLSLQGAAGLGATGYVDARLAFGINLDTGEIYLYENDTSITGSFEAYSDTLTFNAALGPLGLFVTGGTARVDLGFEFSGGTDGWVDMAGAFEGFDLSGIADPVVNATLPLFFPTDSDYLGDIRFNPTISLSADGDFVFGNLIPYVPDLSSIDFSNLSLFDNVGLAIDALDLFMEQVQNFLYGEVFGIELPFIGDSLAAGGDFIENIRSQIIQPFRDIIANAPEVAGDFVQNFLFTILGPGGDVWDASDPAAFYAAFHSLPGLGKLVDPTDGSIVDWNAYNAGTVDKDTADDFITFTYLGEDTPTDWMDDQVQWDLRLGDRYTPDIDLGFDIGFPALGLESDAKLNLLLLWDLALGIGINRTDGAYIDIDNPRKLDIEGTTNDATDDIDISDELYLRADAWFNPGDRLSGKLAFLQVDVFSLGDGSPGDATGAYDEFRDRFKVDASWDNFDQQYWDAATQQLVNRPNGAGDSDVDETRLTAVFQVDLYNEDDTDEEKDEHLSFSELGKLRADVDLQVDAEVNLGLVAKFNEDIIPDAVSALIPQVGAQFVLDWSTGDLIGAENYDFSKMLELVEFRHVGIDMGSFLGDFLGPIVENIQDITEPLQPVIDFMTARIPVVSDLAGRTITLVDIAGLTGYVETGMIYAIADIISLVNSIPAEPGSLIVPIGSLSIIGPGSTDELKFNLTLPDFDLGSDSSGEGGFSLGDALGGFEDGLDTILDGIDTSGSTGATSSSVLNGTAPGAGSFGFPIFESPSEIFGLLLGRPATLITYDLPPFGLDFQWRQSFPVWGPFNVVLTIGAGVTVDLAFGYDTEGVARFVEGDFENPLDLLAGFFISDTDLPQGTGGTDVPELVLEGEVFAGAELNLGIASAGVEGGLILTVNFDLYDPDRDGKVRVDEMLGAFLYEARTGNPALAPVAIFDVYGDISAQLRAYIKALMFEYTFDITPKIVLFEFSIPFDREPILATERGDGALLLNIGANSGSRLNGDTDDFGEEIRVRSIGGGEVEVWGLGVPQSAAQVYKADHIIAYGGEGDDRIFLDLGTSGITYAIEGGSGDDIIEVTGGTGAGLIRGGLGNDSLIGGGGADVIYGEQGLDTIAGGAGNDILFGDGGTLVYENDGTTLKRLFVMPGSNDGDDHLLGDAGIDLLVGGGGNDWLEGGGDKDLLIGDGVNIQYASGALPSTVWTPDAAKAGMVGYDQFGYLTLRLTDTGTGGNDRLFGQDGADVMYGGYGYDLLQGGAGNDRMLGQTGMDTMYGGGGSDLMLGGAHDDIMFGYADAYATENADTVADGDPDSGDTIFGEDGNDYIRGQEGADRLYGDRGADIIFGDAGNDTIKGGINPDTIFGGADDDRIDGEAGNDIVFGDDGLVAFLEFYTTAQATELKADGVLRDVIEIGSLIRTDASGNRLIGDGGATVASLDALVGTFTDDGLKETLDLIVTEVDVDALDGDGTDGNDTINGGAGDDVVLGGAGNDWIGGDIAPADAGALPEINPIGDDVLIGDGGRIELFGRLNRMIMSIPDAESVGIDHIFGDNGNDIAFGGTSGDFIYGGHGSGRAPVVQIEGEDGEFYSPDKDILLGDNGVIELDFGIARRIYTSDVTDQDTPLTNTGGADLIEGNEADDIILGGVNGSPDSLFGNTGNDIILGDNGLLDFGLDPVALTGVEDIESPALEHAQTFYITRYSDTVPVKVTVPAGEYADMGALVAAINTALANAKSSEAVPKDVDLSGDIEALAEGNRITLARKDGSVMQSFLLAASVGNSLGFAPLQTGPDFGTLELIISQPYKVVDQATQTVDDSVILGGGDEISGNEGNDLLIGGVGEDTMYGDNASASSGDDDGEDIMLGDNARIELSGTDGRLLVFGTAVDLITTTDTEEATGGADTMSGNAGNDIMLGGVNNDDGDELNGFEKDLLYGDRALPNSTTIADDGDDIMLGDNGLLDFTYDPADYPGDEPGMADTDRMTLDLIRSFEDALGGIDVISGNKGLDVAIGGTAGDIIYGDDANASAGAADLGDLLIGDNADIFLVAAPLAPDSGFDLKLVLDAAVKTIRTTDCDDPDNTGGSDTISGNAGGDIIAGGVYGDTLYGDRLDPTTSGGKNTTLLDGDDIILGDNGAFEWLSTGRLFDVLGIDLEANNPALWAKYGAGTADTDLSTLDLVTTEQPNSGGRDLIYGDNGRDMMFGGTNADEMYGDDGDGVGAVNNNDLMFGDHGRLYPQFSALRAPGQDWRLAFNSRNFFAIDTGDTDGDPLTPNFGGEGDRMWGEEGDDGMLGQQGDDRMWGGSGNDDMTGGHNVSGGIDELSLTTISASLDGTGISTPAIDDVNDLMDGGTGDDAMAGDNAIVWRRGDDLSPRFRALTAPSIYTTSETAIIANLGSTWQSDPADAVGRDIELIDHADTTAAGLFGADVMAGGADNDVMFGQLANDLMQGDGYIGVNDEDDATITYMISVEDDVDPDEDLYFNIPEAATDGDDYLEGNGGGDLMYGGLGQDDIIGGSSALFGLTTEAMRPDASDVIFGGAGIDIGRNHIGDATEDGTTHVITTTAEGHARDADYIMGDNANVYRLVQGGASGTNPADAKDLFRTFNYDNYGTLKIIPRAMEQLDYHLGGADYNGGEYVNGAAKLEGQPADNGAADLIHGESGDDIIFGMTGSDVIFGEGQDDDIIGGYGNDWITGGTGQDGVLGDDGLILTSRNSTAGEPLNGIAGLLASDPRPKYADGNVLNEVIKTPGDIQYALINVSGELKKTMDLVPFSFDKTWLGNDDEFPDNQDNQPYADDIIFGGLGSDWLHGGSGDDAISGAEALMDAYVPTYDASGNPNGILNLGYGAVGLPATTNPGDVLAFNPLDGDGQHTNNRFRAGEFDLYDEYDPRRIILLTPQGELYKGTDGIEGVDYFQFLLNFNKDEGVLRPGGTVPKATGQQTETYPEVRDDGRDAIFGDLGNDWLVGGTGADDMYGGWGNDLLNADDNHDTNDGLNDIPDTHPFYQDRAYGGAGRDVLIGNTGGDRLIDWVGEYNSYLVPYAPFGAASVSRTLQPFLPEFLYALSAADGADFTRQGDETRNGEPEGEMGLVLQKDYAWQDQTGAPADPQAGNIPGGARDVLRSAGFNDGTSDAFFVDSGVWSVVSGRYQVAPTALGGDALSVFYVDEYIPSYFEMLATIRAVKPTGGYGANAYLIFDYQNSEDFKFAGINVSTSKLEIGYHDASGWHVLVQAPYTSSLKADTDYNVFLALNGSTATLRVNNKTTLTYTFAPRVDGYGIEHFLHEGMVGLGANNARAAIDNVVVQRIAPEMTSTQTVEFSSQAEFEGLFQTPVNGIADGGSLTLSAAPGGTAVDLADMRIAPASVLSLEAVLRTANQGGFVFDSYGPEDFKFVTLDVESDKILVGHSTAKGGIVIDAERSATLDAGTDYTLGITIAERTVSVTLDGGAALSFAFNALVTDGEFGLLARNGDVLFDRLVVRTDDPAYATPALPTISVSDASVTEGDGGQKTVEVTFTLSTEWDAPVTVAYATVAGTAQAGEDYLEQNGTVTFDPGETSRTVAFTVYGDDVVEPDETFTIELFDSENAVIADKAGLVTIVNDDAPAPTVPVISVSDASVLEGDKTNKTKVSVTISLSAATTDTVSVRLKTQDGTAWSGFDYVAADTAITFAPGETSKTYTLTVNGDKVAEFDETFDVVLSEAVGATIGDGTGVITIKNDDGTPLTADIPASGEMEGVVATETDLAPIVEAAIDLWAEALGEEAVAALHDVEFQVGDLSGQILGLTGNGTVFIDADAAGYGWFVDPTPLDDSEFTGGTAEGMDLLTAVMHEFGHVLGFRDVPAALDCLMSGTLEEGVRHLPSDLAMVTMPSAAKSSLFNFAPPSNGIPSGWIFEHGKFGDGGSHGWLDKILKRFRGRTAHDGLPSLITMTNGAALHNPVEGMDETAEMLVRLDLADATALPGDAVTERAQAWLGDFLLDGTGKAAPNSKIKIEM
ncbi:MAG TPA: hypothetical protein DGF30_12660 [Desulfomicrobium sp.]|nr:hypothetical protein [Desulfomicrobium sp.]